MLHLQLKIVGLTCLISTLVQSSQLSNYQQQLQALESQSKERLQKLQEEQDGQLKEWHRTEEWLEGYPGKSPIVGYSEENGSAELTFHIPITPKFNAERGFDDQLAAFTLQILPQFKSCEWGDELVSINGTYLPPTFSTAPFNTMPLRSSGSGMLQYNSLSGIPQSRNAEWMHFCVCRDPTTSLSACKSDDHISYFTMQIYPSPSLLSKEREELSKLRGFTVWFRETKILQFSPWADGRRWGEEKVFAGLARWMVDGERVGEVDKLRSTYVVEDRPVTGEDKERLRMFGESVEKWAAGGADCPPDVLREKVAFGKSEL